MRTILKIGCFLPGVMVLLLFAALYGAEPARTVSTDFTAEPTDFPRSVAGTSLEVLRYGGYEGPYLEDGSNDEVRNVASILLKNTGEKALMYGIILVEAGEEVQSFSCGVLLPGMTALVLEADRKQYTEAVPGRIQGTVRCEDTDRSLLHSLSVTDVDMGTIRVTNCGDDTLRDFSITYKNSLPEEIVLLGGVCYKTEPITLAPGESKLVHPDHYASGYSRIVWAE